MNEPSATRPQAAGRSNRTLWILVIVFAVPYLAALVLYLGDFGFLKQKTSNYGVLVSPVRPAGEWSLRRLDGTAMGRDDLLGKWTFITVIRGDCHEACQESFYKMRQVRLALAEDRTRVQRLAILTDGDPRPEFEAALPEYPGMEVVTGPAVTVEDVLDWLAPDGVDPAYRVYLVDPLGNLMMMYPADAEPEGMLKDMQRLMMVSQIG